MNDHLLALYHRLPWWLRTVVISLQGWQLERSRYGPETEALVAAARERESWTPEQWRTWQEEQLSRLLHRAATRVPYYREAWAARRRRGDRRSWEYLEHWPLLEKEAVRRQPRAFLAEDCRPEQLIEEHTSGTSGTPLTVWCSRAVLRQWYALLEGRVRRWHGVSRRDRWAMLGGRLITAVAARRPPFWVWNLPMRQLYMSSYHLAPDLIPFYLDALKAYRVKYLLGYTSSLYALAQEALRRGRRDLAMTVVFTNAEPVFPYQRQAIAEAFHCPVVETYGMAELALGAGECEAGTLHLWPEVGLVEIWRDGGPLPPGETGELVLTGLLNQDMPLIRYRVGDTGALADPGASCPCGRRLPALKGVEGRVDDVLYTADGRQVGRLDPAFKSELPIREAQIIQESLQKIRVRYVPTPEYTAAAGEVIIRQLKARLGEMEVVLEAVSEVPRGPNGKFKAVICNLPQPAASPGSPH